MFVHLLIILLSLFSGYLIRLPYPRLLQQLQHVLNGLVYVILFLMGAGLAQLDNLDTNLFLIVRYTLVTAFCILSFNLLALVVLARFYPWKHPPQSTQPISRISSLLDSLKFCAMVAIGFCFGFTDWSGLQYAHSAAHLILILLLFLVGLQLGNYGMTLRQLTLNRHGLIIAFVTLISSLLGGIFAAILLNLSIKTGLALASGYGWYSLSGIVLTTAYGPIIGSAAFFNDLIRELFAIMLIPLLVRYSPTVALGICGSTSIDVTLPILRRSGGLILIPAAIAHGFVLSLISPIFMGFFS